MGVEAREQELIVIAFNKTVKQRPRKRHTDVSFGNIVFERRLIENIINNHPEGNIA